MRDDSLYDPGYVRSLFDEMAATYGIVNLLSSFGFTIWWRRQCARSIPLAPSSTILDLMAGMGELSTELSKAVGPECELRALDISPVMCGRAREQRLPNPYTVLEADALACPIGDDSVDAVLSTFGLKTFSKEQLASLASEVHRVLRPGGRFSFLEVSVPPSAILRMAYLFYLCSIVPVIGRLLLGNPENYRMLGVYTKAFGNCDATAELFRRSGLVVERRTYFFGCATGIVGHKPEENDGDLR